MKLLCVNASVIREGNHDNLGTGLVEGQVYETDAKSYINEHGRENYYIKGLGGRLKCRFAELLDDADVAQIKEEKSIGEQLEEAIANEDYETASKLANKTK